MSSPLAHFDSIQTRLNAANFPIVGAVDYERALPLYAEHAERYRQWIENGSQGEMAYLARGLERRLNPKLVYPDLQSVITVARPYSPHPVGTGEVRYARYLNGPDYHEKMKADLAQALDGVEFDYKICVDTSAVLERSWGVLTGLGWVGKNTLLIHPQHGSYLFIGVIFTNQIFGRDPLLLKDYCGSCSRCMSECPTQAIEPAHYVESRKCISYLTLEKRGPFAESIDTKGFVAGCDLCQEVCPYNSKAVKRTPPGGALEYLNTDLEYLLKESEMDYQLRVKGTALSRIKFIDFKRNLSQIETHKK
jgi:epoxyqueuosine reductase